MNSPKSAHPIQALNGAQFNNQNLIIKEARAFALTP